MPQLLEPRVREVVMEMNINQQQSLGEADSRLAALARELGGFVVSNDTDLVIFKSRGLVLRDSIKIGHERGQMRMVHRDKLAEKLRMPAELLLHYRQRPGGQGNVQAAAQATWL